MRLGELHKRSGVRLCFSGACCVVRRNELDELLCVRRLSHELRVCVRCFEPLQRGGVLPHGLRARTRAYERTPGEERRCASRVARRLQNTPGNALALLRRARFNVRHAFLRRSERGHFRASVQRAPRVEAPTRRCRRCVVCDTHHDLRLQHARAPTPLRHRFRKRGELSPEVLFSPPRAVRIGARDVLRAPHEGARLFQKPPRRFAGPSRESSVADSKCASPRHARGAPSAPALQRSRPPTIAVLPQRAPRRGDVDEAHVAPEDLQHSTLPSPGTLVSVGEL